MLHHKHLGNFAEARDRHLGFGTPRITVLLIILGVSTEIEGVCQSTKEEQADASELVKCHSKPQNCSAGYAKTNKEKNPFPEGQGIYWRFLKKTIPHYEGKQLYRRGRQSKDIQCNVTEKAAIIM